jgi:hypothetical protein
MRLHSPSTSGPHERWWRMHVTLINGAVSMPKKERIRNRHGMLHFRYTEGRSMKEAGLYLRMRLTA